MELEDNGLSQRGYLYALGSPRVVDGATRWDLQLLDWTSSRQRHKVYSTWAAEIFNAVDTVDGALIMMSALQELCRGVYQTPEKLIRLWQRGGFKTPMIVFTDCRSIFSAVSSEHIRTPTEKSTLFHAQWIRQLIDCHVLILVWLDTRDMICDGLTKGSVDREALQKAMQGHWVIAQETASFPPEKP